MYASYIKAGSNVSIQHHVSIPKVAYTLTGVHANLSNVPNGIKVTFNSKVPLLDTTNSANETGKLTDSNYSTYLTNINNTGAGAMFFYFSSMTRNSTLKSTVSIAKSGFIKNSNGSFSISQNTSSTDDNYKWYVALNNQISSDLPLQSWPSNSQYVLSYGSDSNGNLVITSNTIICKSGTDSPGPDTYSFTPFIDSVSVY